VSNESELLAATGRAALVEWAPAGRAVRGGAWREQAVSTLDLIEAALAEGRRDEAAQLGRHLVVEAQEIHDLYTDWSRALPEILAREGVPEDFLAECSQRLVRLTGAEDPAGDWDRFVGLIGRFTDSCKESSGHAERLSQAVEAWRQAHDRHRDLVAGWIDVAVSRLGEERLGEVWRELMADGIEAYRRYDPCHTPWAESFPFVVQTAIEGMHGHLGGPLGRGEVAVEEHDDRVELEFAPCGSGGRLRAAERFGVTRKRYDWAWNEEGVCHYCVHCCVLMQLEPIDRFGFPVRVIDPPVRPGERCRWTAYRDPADVPEAAYERVGREKPPSG
jgi:hypothetical protein